MKKLLWKEMYTWNTGRHYSISGQRVAAGLTVEGEIYFYDVDRLVCGQLNVDVDTWLEDPRAVTMREYDHTRYEGTSISMLETLAHAARLELPVQR